MYSPNPWHIDYLCSSVLLSRRSTAAALLRCCSSKKRLATLQASFDKTYFGQHAVMDPVSIFTAICTAGKVAKTAWDIGERLYDIIKDVKNVSKTVQDLVRSTKAFGDTCELVRISLTTLEEAYSTRPGSPDPIHSSADKLLWQGVQSRLEECQAIVEELDSALAGTKTEKSKLVAQIWRQFKLDWKEEDLAAIQRRLNNHTSTLSLSLQAIKM
jgi:hypothetical protein